jgi:hypothetical protein
MTTATLNQTEHAYACRMALAELLNAIAVTGSSRHEALSVGRLWLERARKQAQTADERTVVRRLREAMRGVEQS